MKVQNVDGGIKSKHIEQAIDVTVHDVDVEEPPWEARGVLRRDPSTTLVADPGERDLPCGMCSSSTTQARSADGLAEIATR
jgi:hypothetical protein